MRVSNTEKGGKTKREILVSRRLKMFELLSYHLLLLYLNPVKQPVPYTHAHTHAHTYTHNLLFILMHVPNVVGYRRF